MTKYFALFMLPASVVDEWKKNTKPEEMKSASEKMMRDWENWQKAHKKNLVELGSASREDEARELEQDFQYPERSQLVLDRRGRVARCGGKIVRRQSSPADSRLLHRSHGDTCSSFHVSSLVDLDGSMTARTKDNCASSARLPRQPLGRWAASRNTRTFRRHRPER